MKSKSMSPVISTLIVLGITLVVAGITYTWTSTYTQEQTKSVQEQVDVNKLVQAQSAIGLVLKSASTTGKLIISNGSSQPLTINRLMVDGNLISISPVSIPAGGIAKIDANEWLSAGQSVTLITSAGASKTITVTGEKLIEELIQRTSTALFSDLLDNQDYINPARTNANITAGEARLSSSLAWLTLGDLNISNNTGVSYSTSLALDANGNPSIAWYDNTSGNYEVYYRDWNGTNWVTAAGNLSGPDLNVSSNIGDVRWQGVSLALDVNGNPSIAWDDNTSGNYDVYYRDWNGSNWVTAAGNLSGPDLNVSNTAVSSGTNSPTMLELDANGNPGIAWSEISPGYVSVYIAYRDWNGTNWVTASGSIGTTNLKAIEIPNDIYSASLALDENGLPSIAASAFYAGQTDIDYTEWSGSSWVVLSSLRIISNAGISSWPYVVLDVNSNPSIAWMDNTLSGNYEIYYYEWSGSGWVVLGSLNISNTSGESALSSLALDANGLPSIAWRDNTPGNYDIYYRDWNGSNWVTATGNLSGPDLNVSNTSGWSEGPSLALDANGNPSIAWKDYTSGNWKIYYREWDENFASGNTAESIEVDSVTTKILSATLTASTATPVGTTISFFLSNDNGSTWQPATPGIELTFASTGSQLKWRADLNSSSSRITPRIYNVSISYVYEA